MLALLARLGRVFLASHGADTSALTPGPHLEKLSDSPPTWRARDAEPYLSLERIFAPGWLRIRARVQAENGGCPRVYYDTGDGFNEGESVVLADTGDDQAALGYIRIVRPIRALRFVPALVPTEFKLLDFRAEPLSDLRMLWEAARWKYNDMRTRRNFSRSFKYGLGLLLKFNFREFRQKLFPTEAISPQQHYEEWCAKRAMTPGIRATLSAQIATWPRTPLISILLPVYNVPEEYLRKALDSVLAQIYPHWELCVADDRSPAPHVRAVLDDYALKDARIKVVYRETNGHISAASNSALALATGDYCALLDHDDELSAHALLEVARAVAADPTLDYLYSDEDKLDPNGRRVDPFFKPDWSPEYLLACMYTCHLSVYRTAILREVGGFRSQFDTAQDYDLVLRVTSTTQRIHHVPDILYHWRMLPTSTASGAAAKPKAHLVAQAVLRDHLARNGVRATVEEGPATGFHRVRFEILGKPKISIVIVRASHSPVENGVEVDGLERCIDSIIQKSTWREFEIIVLDRNRLSPAMQVKCASLGVRRIAYDDDCNFARLANRGVLAAMGEYIVLLNDDMTIITPGWMEALLEFAQRDGVGAVGAKLLLPDDRVQHVGIVLLKGEPQFPYSGFPKDDPGYYFSSLVPRNWLAVSGACVMSRKSVYESVGGFNEELALNYCDVDYCMKLVASGRRVVYTPDAQLYHHESTIHAKGVNADEAQRFRELWRQRFPEDPFVNPNLTMENAALIVDRLKAPPVACASPLKN